MSQATFRAGVGRVTITPPLTVPHAGWGAQTHILPDGIETDLWATVFQHLGIDWQGTSFPDFRGRPMPILPSGEPIRELV